MNNAGAPVCRVTRYGKVREWLRKLFGAPKCGVTVTVRGEGIETVTRDLRKIIDELDAIIKRDDTP